MTSAGLVRASWAGTAVFAVAAFAAVVVEHLEPISLGVDVVLFGLGCLAFLGAIVVAARRSREVEMGIGGLFFLAGSAPKQIRTHLLGALGVQVVVAFLTASLRIFTPLAGGMLVPVFGLGMAGLWGARFGEFPARRKASHP